MLECLLCLFAWHIFGDLLDEFLDGDDAKQYFLYQKKICCIKFKKKIQRNFKFFSYETLFYFN